MKTPKRAPRRRHVAVENGSKQHRCQHCGAVREIRWNGYVDTEMSWKLGGKPTPYCEVKR